MSTAAAVILYTKNTLGDFLHKVVPLLVHLKSKGKTVYLENTGGNPWVDELIATLLPETLNAPRPPGATVYTFDGPGATFDGKFRIAYTQQFYRASFRTEVLAYFRAHFPPRETEGREGTKQIVLCIGSVNKNRRGRNDNHRFQDRLATLLDRRDRGGTGDRQRYVVVGLPDELVSPALKRLLATDDGRRIENALGRTGLQDLIQLFYRTPTVVVRNTGLLHLAGLCNAPIVTLYANCSVLDTVAIFTGWRPDVIVNTGATVEAERLYYTEVWSPLSEQVTSIIEYRSYDPWYNATVVDHLATALDQLATIGSGQMKTRRRWRTFLIFVVLGISCSLWIYHYGRASQSHSCDGGHGLHWTEFSGPTLENDQCPNYYFRPDD